MRARSASSMLALSGAIAIAVAACGGADTGSEAASTTTIVADSNTDATTGEAAQVVEAALVPTASGEDLDFNSLRGKDVLLWFWAPW